MQRGLPGLERQRRACRAAGGYQILDHLVLAVHRDEAPARQFREIDPVAPATKRNIDALVLQALPPEPLSEPGIEQKLDRSMLQNAGSHPLNHIIFGAILENV